ncbi:MAG TPA: hypothetical protein VFA63_14065 [Pseudonocardiaceae bacterium]|nr:hypothetical protein [Pseudonocardiaceae bacterium]
MDIQATIWRDLAQQAVVAASHLQDPALRLSMLSIAAGYEAMAKRAEAVACERALARAKPA